MLPSLLLGDVEEAGILGAVAVHLRGHQKLVSDFRLPIIVKERLAAGPFAAEAADADLWILMEQLHPFVVLDPFGIILIGIPDGEDDDFFPIAQFLDAEIALIPPAR